MSESNGFLYSEARFAKHVGITSEECRFMRNLCLKEGQHWKKTQREIVLTLPAIKRLCVALKNRPSTLKLSECRNVPPQEKNGACEVLAIEDKPSVTNPRKLRVKRIFANPYMLLAYDLTGGEFNVRVPSNLNFIPHQELKAAPDAGAPGFWVLVGPVPRVKGRWI